MSFMWKPCSASFDDTDLLDRHVFIKCIIFTMLGISNAFTHSMDSETGFGVTAGGFAPIPIYDSSDKYLIWRKRSVQPVSTR